MDGEDEDVLMEMVVVRKGWKYRCFFGHLGCLGEGDKIEKDSERREQGEEEQ